MLENKIFNSKKPTISFEIFPPKGTKDLGGVFATIDALASLAPDFISVTYGAGGSSRENTVEIVSAIQTKYNIPGLAHLTCISNTAAEMDELLQELQEKGVKNILALRGDIPEDGQLGDFKYASELTKYIKEHYDFSVLGACYPHKHPEAYSMGEDLRYLKEKVECGSDALISQLFFDNEAFYNFCDKVRGIGVDVPVIAGIMPLTSAKQVERMVSMCGAKLPDSVQQFVQAYGHNSLAMKEAGIAYATEQIVDLLAHGVDGIHIYTMNQPDIAKRIVENIRGILYALKIKRA